MTVGKTICTAFIASLASSAVHAQSITSLPEPARPALNLSDPRLSLNPARQAADVAQPAVNRTSVEHTFGPQGVTASVGYLCGLEPPSDRTPGPLSSFGPISTFLGGKLTYAFK